MEKKKITIVIEQAEENSKNYWFLMYKGNPLKITPEWQLKGNDQETLNNLKDALNYIENEL